MTSRVSLCASIDTVARELFDFGLASMFNHTIADAASGRISWVRTSHESVIDDFNDFTVEQYLNWVERSDYTIMLSDGALMQMTYQFGSAEIDGHRLCYVPNPFSRRLRKAPSEEPEVGFGESAWESIVERSLEQIEKEPFSIGLRSMIRFDYDPKNAKSGHPASHLTLNSVDCRIPCVDLMTPYNFVDFIFTNFYPGLRDKYANYFDNLGRWRRNKLLFTEMERAGVHVNWGG